LAWLTRKVLKTRVSSFTIFLILSICSSSITLLSIPFFFSFIQISSVANAQVPFGDSSSPLPNTDNTPATTTNNQSLTSTQQQAFLTYADPQGRFSIDYPYNWIAKPAANRFSSSLVEFVSPVKGLNFADVDIRVIKNMPFGVESAFNIVFPSLRTSLPNFELNEGPNCEKYTTADGNHIPSY
jgi:hypothetical protein